MTFAGPQITTYTDSVVIFFDQTLMIASITNANFTLVKVAATPIAIVNPFQPIDLLSDYDATARALTLYYNIPPLANTSYNLTFSGLFDVAGRTIPTTTLSFISLSSEVPYTISPPDAEPTPIQDNSIITKPFIVANTLTAINPNFYIMDTDPNNDSVFLNDNNYNRGIVTVKFSNFPADQYIASQYFIAQKKLISRDFQVWQNIPGTVVSRDQFLPWVYIQFPLSRDATPVYFQSQYKYRVKVSKDVGSF